MMDYALEYDRMVAQSNKQQELIERQHEAIVKLRGVIQNLTDHSTALLLVSDPDGFRKHDSPNGWGRYIHFLPFVTAVLMACMEYPDADVRACR